MAMDLATTTALLEKLQHYYINKIKIVTTNTHTYKNKTNKINVKKWDMAGGGGQALSKP